MATAYEFETLLALRSPEEPRVLEVVLNRPKNLNAINRKMFAELKECMDNASKDPDVHCVLLHGGSCRLFTAGLDLNEGFGETVGDTTGEKIDVSRRAIRMEPGIRSAQDGISALEKCSKPVVVALHNAVIGGGIDIASACDVRYCTEDTFFCIAEVNIGIAADVGTLQRLPKIVGNDSFVREAALTGRRFLATEAKELGLIGAIYPDREKCVAAARKVATEIAAKSPVAVIATKASLNYSRDHSVQEGLDHVRLMNTLHLQSKDVPVAVKANLTKTKPEYSRL